VAKDIGEMISKSLKNIKSTVPFYLFIFQIFAAKGRERGLDNNPKTPSINKR
jgi:hypothetical protein